MKEEYEQGNRKKCRPVRTCTSCGKKKEKDRLLRYVWRDSGIVADQHQVLPGRGVYCCTNEKCVELLYKRKKKWKRLFRL
ncbi:YlxR family protein [Desulfomarina profundi]|uniref:YlxR family protein n=1 Tax=Desulfomarina profundi TaxID=2772557 RepID=UPI001E531069|nr:YlxR family protein [Desulfomarina profundi]